MTEIIRGFKFLNAYNATTYDTEDYIYPVPGPGEKWGPWLRHPEPGEPDGKDCGAGGWHIMRKLDARYAPRNWWPWFADGHEVLGESSEKARVVEIRLRRITRTVFWKIIRMGYCRGAYLGMAYLRGADLGRADLRGADLGMAYLRGAYLRGADLRRADLRRAYLRWADLRGADLRWADLRGADLRGADLSNAHREYAKDAGAII